MYLEHFGLQRQPFKITPDTSLFYKGNKRGAALDALKYAIISGEGIIKVVGEVGSGKTMLCRMLEVELPDNIEVVYIANPSLSPENILHVIAFELKLDVTNESTKLEVMQQLQNYLVAKHAANKQVVVFVEEAQSMPLETLEEIRLLSNLETNDHKLLQMVLFGQPELDEKLRDQSIRQLKERITHSFYLDPFPKTDIYEYLNFRMRAVGYRGPDIFSQKVANNIEKKSKGLTRRINILADKALMAVFSEGAHGVSTKHIAIAADDSDFGTNKNWKPYVYTTLAVVALTLAVWVGTLIPGLGSNNKNPTVKETTRTDPIVTLPAENIIVEKAVEVTDVSDLQIALLDERLQVTSDWLKTADPTDFTIQLTLLDAFSSDMINKFVEESAQILGKDNLYIYKAVIRGNNVYSVLFSNFATREEAIASLKSLPRKLKEDGAYLRTVKGIISDIEKSKHLVSG